VHLDSRAVAMEGGIRYGVCNNSPAECTSPENGRCLNEPPIVRRDFRIFQSESRVGRLKPRNKALKRKLEWISDLVQILVVVANIQSENIED